jgi:hypothetical protein
MSPHQRMLIPLPAVDKFRVIRSAGSTAAGSGVYGMDSRSVVPAGVVCCSSVATAAAWTPCAGTRRLHPRGPPRPHPQTPAPRRTRGPHSGPTSAANPGLARQIPAQGRDRRRHRPSDQPLRRPPGPLPRPCACRKCHLRWSGSVVVLVEDAAQTWVLVDVEAVDLGLVDDRRWQQSEWSGVGDALVGPVRVIEAFVFAECVE